jgi:hypothetical protein
MLGCEELETARGLAPGTEPPGVSRLHTEIPVAVDARAAAARAIPPGEGGPACGGVRSGEEPPHGEPRTVPSPADAPPAGQPNEVPPINDPPPARAPVTEPPAEVPVIQAAVVELEPVTAPPR